MLLPAFKHGTPGDKNSAAFFQAHSSITCRFNYLSHHYNAVFRLGSRNVVSRIEVRGASNGEPVLLLVMEAEKCVDNVSAFEEYKAGSLSKSA